MILYDPNIIQNLSIFGIQIPIYENKVKKIIDGLLHDPILHKNKKKWIISKIKTNITKTDLERVHSKQYIDKLFSENLKEEIIKTFELIAENGQYHRYKPDTAKLELKELFLHILKKVEGTYYCCQLSLQCGFCFFCGGGMHHAKKNYGEGFCLVNDLVIAVRKLQFNRTINTAWIIDLDAHKGDGTACLTKNDQNIITLSIHMANGWPLDITIQRNNDSENPYLVPSNIDIPVTKNECSEYNYKLMQGLNKLSLAKPADIAIIVDGADPWEKDELKSTELLKLNLDQLLARDIIVYNFLKKRNIPMAYVMAGGYGKQTWKVYIQFLKWALKDHYEL